MVLFGECQKTLPELRFPNRYKIPWVFFSFPNFKMICVSLKKFAAKLNSINERKPTKNNSIIDNSIQMEGIEETSELSFVNETPKQPSFHSMETLLDLFEVYLELRSCLHA